LLNQFDELVTATPEHAFDRSYEIESHQKDRNEFYKDGHCSWSTGLPSGNCPSGDTLRGHGQIDFRKPDPPIRHYPAQSHHLRSSQSKEDFHVPVEHLEHVMKNCWYGLQKVWIPTPHYKSLMDALTYFSSN
jgi:hypothetical protein